VSGFARDGDFLFRRAAGGWRVFHRATGLWLGEVVQIPRAGRDDDGTWVSYSATELDGAAVHDTIELTRRESAEALLDPTVHASCMRKCCPAHTNTMSITPFPCGPDGARCETDQEAEARARVERPAEWMLYDAVERLPDPSAFWRCCCCGEHQVVAPGELPGNVETAPCACMRRECRRGPSQHGGSWAELATWDAEPSADQQARMAADCATKAALGHLGAR